MRAFFKTAKAASICDIFLSVVFVAAGFFGVVALAVFGAGCFLAAGFFAEAFLAGAVLVAVVVFLVAMFVFPLLGVSRFRVGHRGQRDHTVELLANIDNITARCRATLQLVDRLTPSLLAKAFRGQLVPQDPNDEPASVLLERIRAAKSNIKAKSSKRKPKSKAT
ncbi:hypothetical protein [Neorhodopirellula pilleata]|uniref:hypothetical protein n=1 Tax=Neorhodopirellula pilleata TaxID=2714738 RepID=UPI0018CFE851|nr:hypothetical protein [Neorhodopirellula pilleata]